MNVTGALRSLQTNLLCNLLKPHLKPSPYSHGGIVGRSIKTNAEPHRESVYYFTTDIADFYPTVSHHRIYRLSRTSSDARLRSLGSARNCAPAEGTLPRD